MWKYANSDNTVVNSLDGRRSVLASDPEIQEWINSGNTPDAFEAPALSNVEIRNNALQAMVYDFGDGRVMQVRPQDEQNIKNAIEYMTVNTIAHMNWVMEDNTIAAVTPAELQTAFDDGQAQAVAIWATYTTSI